MDSGVKKVDQRASYELLDLYAVKLGYNDRTGHVERIARPLGFSRRSTGAELRLQPNTVQIEKIGRLFVGSRTELQVFPLGTKLP